MTQNPYETSNLFRNTLRAGSVSGIQVSRIWTPVLGLAMSLGNGQH